jgi:hypothetical protein
MVDCKIINTKYQDTFLEEKEQGHREKELQWSFLSQIISKCKNMLLPFEII